MSPRYNFHYAREEEEEAHAASLYTQRVRVNVNRYYIYDMGERIMDRVTRADVYNAYTRGNRCFTADEEIRVIAGWARYVRACRL